MNKIFDATDGVLQWMFLRSCEGIQNVLNAKVLQRDFVITAEESLIDNCMAKIYTTLFNKVLGDCQYLKAGRSNIYLLFRKFGFNTTRIATQCWGGGGEAQWANLGGEAT